MIGKRISHYEVVEKLGEGGMGVVYRAEDTKLGRSVALKFLPADALANGDDKARFVQEARSTAALDHPNICTIYEIDECDGEMYIAMAHIEGVTLREIIDRGPVSVETALDLSLQVADGLLAAHDKDIVHRDIKSGNIMVNERGQARIMDFGLAKLIGSRRSNDERNTAGTVAYMSPEQTRGDEVDGRTDMWSLGVVMYEMLAGKRPFRGDYQQSVIYAIVNEDPEPVTALRSGVPAEFERIVQKAMAKRAKDRYQRAQDLIDDLRALKAELDSKTILSRAGQNSRNMKRVRAFAVPTVVLAVVGVVFVGMYLRSGLQQAEGSQIPIAVADFQNTTGEAQLDGLSGMLITALEQSRRLSVLTRSSMLGIIKQLGQEGVTRIDEELGREICRRMNIDVLVTASIHNFDDLYTIDLKAFRMGIPGHLFTAREEGQGRSSIPGMIDRIAQKTRKGLNEKSRHILATSESVADVTTPNLDAYQQFFQGEQFIGQLKFKDAQEAFHKAIELDSSFALAHYRLAYANWWGGESEEIQRAQLDKALALIDRLPEKFRYLLRAQHAVSEDGYAEGITILREMETIYPDDKEMIYNIGDYSFHAEEYDQAETYLNRVLTLDPEHARALNHLGMTYNAQGKEQKTIEVTTRYADLTNADYAYLTLSNAYLSSGQADEALRVVERALTVLPGSPVIRRQIATVRCMKDEYEVAKSMLDSLVGEDLEPRYQQMVRQSLVGADLYMGRYRDALAETEVVLQAYLEQGDSVAAMFQHQRKGIIYAWGWHDSDNAAREFERARTIHASLGRKLEKNWEGEYSGNISTFYLLTDQVGDVNEIAENQLRDDPFLYDRARFFLAWRDGDYDTARAMADTLLTRGRERDKTIVLYYLAKVQLEHGHFDAALESLHQLQAKRHYSGPRPMFYPASYFLLGQSYEKKGDTRAAIESYGKFVELWRAADDDLPLLREARVRLAALESSATQ